MSKYLNIHFLTEKCSAIYSNCIVGRERVISLQTDLVKVELLNSSLKIETKMENGDILLIETGVQIAIFLLKLKKY